MNSFESNNMQQLDQTRHVGIMPQRAPGRAADSIQMPDSTPDGLTQANGVRVGSLLLFREPPYQKLVVRDEAGRTFRGEAALPILFTELRGICTNATDAAAAIAESVEAV